MTPQNLEIMKLVYASLENPEKKIAIPAELTKPLDSLPLFIKKYPFPKGLSKEIWELENNTKCIIEGPYGRGLELTPETKGKVAIICGGTGVLLFLDFIHYLYMQTAYKIFMTRGDKKNADAILALGYDFSQSFNLISVKFCGAFAKQEEAYGYDIVLMLAKVNQKFKLDVFEAIMTVAKGDQEIKELKDRFNRQMLQNYVGSIADRYYVCGPPGMNKSVPEQLAGMGVPKGKIILV